jgi:Skp family chaperone for outer membrane proteins
MYYFRALVLGTIVAFVAVSITGAKPANDKKPDEKNAEEKKPEAKAPSISRPTIAVFNMAAIMRDFNQAKYQVYLLNKKKIEMSKNLIDLREEYTTLAKKLKEPAPPTNPNKDNTIEKLRDAARKVEDEDRKINKQLNDEAGVVISGLYDKTKSVVDKVAELNGYRVVFAYPDAVTPEELKSAYIKELKLKPPAAQPFYVDPVADVTGIVVKTLNTWYPPIDPETKKPVDVSNLPPLPPMPPMPALVPPPAPGTPPLKLELPMGAPPAP